MNSSLGKWNLGQINSIRLSKTSKEMRREDCKKKEREERRIKKKYGWKERMRGRNNEITIISDM